jgi:hypothetical protein
MCTECVCEASWENDKDSALCEIEDGQQKVWTREPTKTRGTVGVKKQMQVGTTRCLDKQETFRRSVGGFFAT